MLNSAPLKTLLRRSPLLYIDAGARGDLEGDWALFPDGCLSVLGFEPDKNAPIDWEKNGKLRYLERSALWSHETEVDIHIGKVPSTSSVWPPNMEYLARFAEHHVQQRVTQSIARVKARPLDAVLSERSLKADFLKIDTQGAEMQILHGASQALDNSIIGAMVETWTAPVHKGQGLTHDVMALMYERGFVVCQIGAAAAWDRKIVEREKVTHHRQITGLDIFFLRDPLTIMDRFRDATYAAKFAVIAQIYGNFDLALEAIDAGLRYAVDDKNLLEAARHDLREACVAITAPPPAQNFLQRFRDRVYPPRPVARKSETKLHY